MVELRTYLGTVRFELVSKLYAELYVGIIILLLLVPLMILIIELGRSPGALVDSLEYIRGRT